MTHPNRSKRSTDNPARNPKPEEMRAAREARGLTPADAAKLCFNTGNWWEECEAGTKRCHPAIWQYWLHRVERAAIARKAIEAARSYVRTTRPLLSDKGMLYGRMADELLELLDQADELP